MSQRWKSILFVVLAAVVAVGLAWLIVWLTFTVLKFIGQAVLIAVLATAIFIAILSFWRRRARASQSRSQSS